MVPRLDRRLRPMRRQLRIPSHHRLAVPKDAIVIHIVLIHSSSGIVLHDHAVAVEVGAVRRRLCQSTL